MNILKKIFSITNSDAHKIFTILGVKIKCSRSLNYAKLSEFKDEIKDKLAKIPVKEDILAIKDMAQYMSGMYPNFVYNNPFEYEFLKERWSEMDKYLSKDSYEKLIQGLDDDSIGLVQRTLTRIRKILSSNAAPLDLWTQEEMPELYFMLHTFITSILKISDNVYACGKYLLPINHFEKGIFIDKHGVNLLNQENIKNKAIIDVGAFIGDSACVLSEKTNDKVYCFEALSDNYEMMLKTVEYNHLNNVVPVKFALGEANGKAETINLYEEIANGSCCQVKEINNDTTSANAVNVITLDEYVNDNNINVGLIKVDIEGSEQQFLAGAKETIRNQKPSLIMSIYHNPNDFFNIKNILQELVPEYKFKLFKPIDGNAAIDTVLLCEI